MSSHAKLAFDLNIQRAAYFLDIHEATQSGPGAPKLPRRELPRGAIVFAVGAIDAYLSELSAEVLVRQLETAPASQDKREVLKRVANELPTLSIELALLATQQERLNRLRESVVEYFSNQISNHGSKAVSNTLIRVGARPADVWNSLGSLGYKDPPGELDRWTSIRHQIVHQGRKPKVQRPAARVFVELAKSLAEEIDKAVAKC